MSRRFPISLNPFAWAGPSSTDYPTVNPDGTRWNFQPEPERIVAIGDLHGNLEALCNILLERALINEEGKWIGENSHLVLMGDLVGGHKHSRLLLNFVMRLEEEAKARGSRVHAILGNHDILPVQKNFRKFSLSEKKFYKEYPVPGAEGTKVHHAFRGNALYAKWIRERNTMVQIGDTLFVHAGIGTWALHALPDAINATVRAWVRFWQGIAEKPPKKTVWAAGRPEDERGSDSETGPVWLRAFREVRSSDGNQPKEGPSKEELEQILSKLAVKRVVVGHSPVSSAEIVTSHPYYQDRIVMIDTRVSDEKHGTLSALEIRGEILTTHYPETSKGAEELVKRELAYLKDPVLPKVPLISSLLDSVSETSERLMESLKTFLDD